MANWSNCAVKRCVVPAGGKTTRNAKLGTRNTDGSRLRHAGLHWSRGIGLAALGLQRQFRSERKAEAVAGPA